MWFAVVYVFHTFSFHFSDMATLEEEPEEPSCEELLLDLEQELSKICPWTCPNKVRILLGKIAYKVHKEKDPGEL